MSALIPPNDGWSNSSPQDERLLTGAIFLMVGLLVVFVFLLALLDFWGPFGGILPLFLLPALAGGMVLVLVITRWPVVAIHLSFIGVILDQWEGLSFTGIPFLTLSKVIFLVCLLILLIRYFIPSSPRLQLPSAALAHLPFSLICAGSVCAFAYSVKSAFRWLLAPLTLPVFGIVLAQFITNQKNAIRLLKAFAVYSFFPMLVALMESLLHRRFSGPTSFVLYGIDDIFRVAGSYENPNDFVVLMLFSVPVLLMWAYQTNRWPLRLLLLAGSVLELLILIKTYSRSGYLSMAFSLFAIAWLGKGGIRRLGLIICLIGGVALLSIPDARERLMTLTGMRGGGPGTSQALASVGFRKQLLTVAWTEFLNHPIFGIGYSNIGPRAKTYSSMLDMKTTAENTYMEVLAEMGLIGITAYLFFLMWAWFAMREGLARVRGDLEVEPLFVGLAAGYCGFAFNSLFDTNIQDNLPWVLLAVMVHLSPTPSTKPCNA
jgi:O-antigen ligase